MNNLLCILHTVTTYIWYDTIYEMVQWIRYSISSYKPYLFTWSTEIKFMEQQNFITTQINQYGQMVMNLIKSSHKQHGISSNIGSMCCNTKLEAFE